MAQLNLLAMDYGASNGRGIIGRFDGDKLQLEEIHRFENPLINVNGVQYWDVLKLFNEAKESLVNYRAKYGDTIAGMGIDTWGVDYGLLDNNGQLLGNVISYRMADDEDFSPVWDIVPKRELFDRTGIASLCLNTVYQLYARKRRNDPAVENARTLLMLPDLLGYFLTGEMWSEYTMCSTSQMVDCKTGDWARDLIARLGINPDMLLPITPACQLKGKLLKQVAEETGISRVPYAAIGGHDTASAVAAVPGRGSDFAFLSSGTWSLFGVESEKAILSDTLYEANYSNEGTIQGGYRPLKNIMGLWLIQECRRDWLRAGEKYSWNDIVALAEKAEPLASIINPDYFEFYKAGNMVGKIQEFCRITDQKVPQTTGEVARCIYESLALKYRWAIERLEEIVDRPLSTLNIVGGGTQNRMLNQLAANAMDRNVVTGPIEGACIGNLLGTAIALGEIADIDELREVVRRSFDVEEYQPHHDQAWEDAYGKLLSLLNVGTQF